jgi:hypothetical protein
VKNIIAVGAGGRRRDDRGGNPRLALAKCGSKVGLIDADIWSER